MSGHRSAWSIDFMNLKSARRFASAGALLGVAACTVNLGFDITKDAVVLAPGTTVATTLPIDLANSKEVQEHNSNVESLSLESLDLTVTAVESDNHATSVTGSVALRAADAPADGSRDVAVGTIDALPITVGSHVHIPGSSKLDQFLYQELQGTGQFSAVIAGTTQGGPTHATIRVAMHASLAYGVGL